MLIKPRTVLLAAFGALASTVLSVSLSVAQEPAGVAFTNCVGRFRNFTCLDHWRSDAVNAHVRPIPQPGSDEESRQSRQRDGRWQTRCRPVIKPDAYGVPRYEYTVRGCDFGALE